PLAGVHEVPLELVQHAQQTGPEAARGAESRAGRDVGHARDLDARAADAGQAQRLADDRVLDLVDPLDALDLRIAQDDLFERRLHQRDVDVLVDGRGNQESPVVPVGRRCWMGWAFEGNRDLLERFRRGERSALEQVYWAYVTRVDRLVRRLLHLHGGTRLVAAANVEDLVQDSFTRAFSPSARQAYD